MTSERHPKGTKARVLLTSVFGPYARDDEYGSRAINPMELYHNQVTRVQGVFSLRMFHRSWGIMMIQANIAAPSTVLDFPTLDRFIDEIRTHEYDIVGISSIIPNVGKVKKMCSLIREHQPHCSIVVGGHVANLPDIQERVDADHIVKGEGIAWFRKYLGQPDTDPIAHPEIYSGFGSRAMGVNLSHKPEDTAATVIPSVGCPVGCNFCCTSAMFGGKGCFVNFYETGRELFNMMCRLEERMKVRSFFIMDENFLLHRKRALELLELMRRHEKSWFIDVFSSARTIQSYSIDELVGLGISWVWMGLEGEDAAYAKLRGVDTRALVRELQSHGIRVLGSSIIGLESHTPENIDRVIDYAVSHNTDFHQFMLYTPMPGTPLHAEHRSKGTLLEGVEEADIHGQYAFNFQHPHISREESGRYLLRAFQLDFERNGPSIMRLARTLLQGWHRYKNHPEKRIRERFIHETRSLRFGYASGLWAMEDYFRPVNSLVAGKVQSLRASLNEEFGLTSRLVAPLGGRWVRYMMRREENRLRNGWTYQPRTFYEKRNWGQESHALEFPVLRPIAETD